MTSSPHSVQDDFAALRTEAEWRIPHVRKELDAAINRIEEQLEAAQERLAWAARLLRYPDGGDEFSIDCRNWLNDYYAASSPASVPYCTCSEGADGNPCAVCGKPEAVTYPASKPLCECGHTQENHHGDPMTVAKSPCRATVYTDAPLGGGNAFTCHCRDYVPASEPEWKVIDGPDGQPVITSADQPPRVLPSRGANEEGTDGA